MTTLDTLRTDLHALIARTDNPEALTAALNLLRFYQAPTSLVDAAAAEVLSDDLDWQWSEHQQADPVEARQRSDFDQARVRLADLVPGLLGRPFQPEHTHLRQVHASGWTAAVIIDGYTFIPATYALKDQREEGQYLQVLCHQPSRFSPTSYAAVRNLGDFARILEAETGRSPAQDPHLSVPTWLGPADTSGRAG